MIKYSFNYREEKAREGEVIYRPVACIYLRGKDNKFYLFDGYVDSGADISLFTRSDCALLGYKLEKGKEKLIGGVSGALIRTFVHQIPIKIGNTKFNAEMAFAEIENVPRLIGRKNIFEKFQVLFDEKKLKVYFILVED